MNNRRRQLILASAKEYCKGVILHGKTLAFNQFEKVNNVSNHNYYGMTINVNQYNGIITIVGTSTYNIATDDPNDYVEFQNFDVVAGHKYFVYTSGSQMFCPMLYNGVEGFYSPLGKQYVFTSSFTGIMSQTLRPIDEHDINAGIYINETFHCQIFDLTLMRLDNLSTIDEIMDALQKNGIDMEKNHSYSNGEFSNEYQRCFTFRGRNIWNEKWENGIWNNGTKLTSSEYHNWICSTDLIKVNPRTYYHYCNKSNANDPYIVVSYFDGNKQFISAETWNNNTSFKTPDNCQYIAFYINDTYGDTYEHNICISKDDVDFYGKYEPSCEVKILNELEADDGYGGFSHLQEGDTVKLFKSYVRYNQLIPDNKKNYKNSDTTDSRTDFYLSIYDFTQSVSIFGDGIYSTGSYKYIFTCPINSTSGNALYHSGADRNIYLVENIYFKENHVYMLSLNVEHLRPDVLNGFVVTNITLIDLTELSMGNIANAANFVQTPLGQLINKNYNLKYSLDNIRFPTMYERTMGRCYLNGISWTYDANNKQFYSEEISDAKMGGWSKVLIPKYVWDDNGFDANPNPHTRGIWDKRIYIIDEALNGDVNALTAKISYCLYTLDNPKNSAGNYNEDDYDGITIETSDDGTFFERLDEDYPYYYRLIYDFEKYGALSGTADAGGRQFVDFDDLRAYGGQSGDYCFDGSEFNTFIIYDATPDHSWTENGWTFYVEITSLSTPMLSRRIIECLADNYEGAVNIEFEKI